MGRYTRNAVLSQAFDRRLPILEANSRRVLARLFGRTGDPSRGPEQRWLWDAAEALLPSRRAGDFNQALMELGALVCTPAAPRCGDCPLAADCVARRLGLQDSIPARTPPPEPVLVREAAVVVRRGGRVLLVQRPPEGRWASLWEFPHGPLAPGESADEAAARLAPELTGLRGAARAGTDRRCGTASRASASRWSASRRSTFPANSAPPITGTRRGWRRRAIRPPRQLAAAAAGPVGRRPGAAASALLKIAVHAMGARLS